MDRNLKSDDFKREVLECMREKGIIKLDYTKARSSDRRTPTSTWFILTIAIGIITLLTVFAIPENLFPWIYIRNLFGLAFVLFLPGHSFIKAFFPLNLPKTEGQKELEIIERIGFSVGLSIAIVSLSGLLLYYSPFGSSLEAIVIAIFGVTLLFGTFGEIRQKR